jgi:hypothetical protein
MVRKLGTAAVVMVAFALVGAADSGAAIFVDQARPAAASLYSPAPLAEQTVTLQASPAYFTDLFGASIYGPAGAAGRLQVGVTADGAAFAPPPAPSASLALGGDKAAM